MPQHGSLLLPAGWGRIYQNSNTLPTYLQQTKLPLVDHQTCIRKNGGFVHESSMVCAGASGSSVCQGDSGGPLVCKEGGSWVLRGATSWVTSYACPVQTYSVYARISSYVNWINNKMTGKYVQLPQNPQHHLKSPRSIPSCSFSKNIGS